MIVPSFNAATTIDQQLTALSGQCYGGDWEVIVADNGSGDATKAIARRWTGVLPKLVIVDACQRVGANHARNIAIDVADGDLLLFVDADDVVAPGWLQTMCDAARSFDHFSGTYVNFTDGSSELSPAKGPLKPFGFLAAAWGGNLGVWRDVAAAVGGFNERLVGGGEDVEFSWRAQLRGYSFGWIPEAVVFHRRRATLRGLARQRYLYGKADGRLIIEFAEDGIEAFHQLRWSWARIRGRARGSLRTSHGRRAVVMETSWLTGFCIGWVGESWRRGARGGSPMYRR